MKNLGHMEIHVSDIWQAMCQKACKWRQVHAGHMASHVSKGMQMENCINRRCVRRRREKIEKERRRKNERERKERKIRKEKRDRERKGNRRVLISSVFPRSGLV